ncbi:MAG TPA: F0F1 ATP synthase subunit B [Methylomirabilota bacterium]|nr:F0F1 ATP synthase subunit B [Methylomirabilota bacterium]
MNLDFVLAAAAPVVETGNPITDIATQFGVTWQLLISQIVLFVIVALALKKFAYGPILKVLEERRQRIAESLANAERIKQELASAQTKVQELIGQASAQANKLIEEARAAAARVQEVETQKAIEAANQIVVKARQASEAELARAKAELRKELVRLVADTTAKVTGKVLTLDDQKRLADETTKQLAA